MRKLILLALLVPFLAEAGYKGDLRADTAATLKFCIALAADALPDTTRDIDQIDIRLTKNAGNMAQKNDATANAAHDELGCYDVAINATDTNTEGRFEACMYEAGMLRQCDSYRVLNSNWFDNLYSSANTLLTAEDIGQVAECTIDTINSTTSFDVSDCDLSSDSAYNGYHATIHDVTNTIDLQSVQLTSTSAANDTFIIEVAPSFTVAIGDIIRLSTIKEAQYAVKTELGIYDPPTKAELDSRTLVAANYLAPVATGTADSGTINTIVDSSLTQVDGFWANDYAVTVDFAGGKEGRCIDGFISSSGTLSAEPDFNTAVSGESYTINFDAACQITAAKIAISAIGAAEIASNAIGPDEILDNAITASKIAANAIGASEIATGAIGALEIATDAIGAAEIAADAIGAEETMLFASDGVTDSGSNITLVDAALIQANDHWINYMVIVTFSPGIREARCVTAFSSNTLTFDAMLNIVTNNLLYSLIPSDACGGSLTLGPNSITAAVIADNAIGASEIATDAIGADEIATDAIGSDEIAAGAIGGAEIASNAIGPDEILDNAITSSKIAANAIGASEIATDAIGALEIAIDAIGAAEIAADAIGADEIATAAVDADAIAASAITASAIAVDAITASAISADANAELVNSFLAGQIEDQGSGYDIQCVLATLLAYVAGDMNTAGNTTTYKDPGGTETRLVGTVAGSSRGTITITCPTIP